SAFGWQYTLQGLRFDGAVGLFDNRSRWYSPTLQVFVSQDPLGFGGGYTNLYMRTGNQPVNRVDPSGMAEAADIGVTHPFISENKAALLNIEAKIANGRLAITVKEQKALVQYLMGKYTFQGSLEGDNKLSNDMDSVQIAVRWTDNSRNEVGH